MAIHDRIFHFAELYWNPTMKLLQLLHIIYAFLVFVLLFFLLLPWFFIPIIFPKNHQWTGILNRVWATILFRVGLFPYKLIYHPSIDKKRQYIFCPNHFSYLDIPTMGLNKVNSVFVGKNDMESIPLFGFMYRKLHITVDRNSLKSRYQTLIKSKQAIDDGKSLMIFPEGGILTKNPPKMTRFKDGAFRTAIEKQIPIVPVTIAHNWIILPDGVWLPRRVMMNVTYHEPIATDGLTMSEMEALKQRTYEVIDNELKLQDENRQRATT